MKVWLVADQYDGRIACIFASEEKAKEFCDKHYEYFYYDMDVIEQDEGGSNVQNG